MYFLKDDGVPCTVHPANDVVFVRIRVLTLIWWLPYEAPNYASLFGVRRILLHSNFALCENSYKTMHGLRKMCPRLLLPVHFNPFSAPASRLSTPGGFLVDVLSTVFIHPNSSSFSYPIVCTVRIFKIRCHDFLNWFICQVSFLVQKVAS